MRQALAILHLLVFASVTVAQAPSVEEATAAMLRAAKFFHGQASAGGGYVFRISSDLKLWEGEGKASPSRAWIEPPGTPAVGLAYLEAYQLTGERFLLRAALDTGHALCRGQLRSGGWGEMIEADSADRLAISYRSHVRNAPAKIDPELAKQRRRHNTTTLDDDKTQSCLRFLMRLQQALSESDETIDDTIRYGLRALIAAQYPCGAWPQRFSETPIHQDAPIVSASYPDSWSRKYSGKKYAGHYTLNDNTIADTIKTMLLAYDIYGEERFATSTIKAGEFLLRAQMPDPQPAWAQQYDTAMHPVWARKFEPPAVTGGESQGVIRMLLILYQRTGRSDLLQAARKAIVYLRRSCRDDGRLARFYELKTNRPLYFTRDYQLTYSDRNMPTHYGFVVSSKLDSLEALADRLASKATGEIGLLKREPLRAPDSRGSESLVKTAVKAIKSLDDRGAWVENGEMRNYDNPTGKIIDSKTFAMRLKQLAQFIHSAK